MKGADANHTESVARATSRRRKCASCESMERPSRSMPSGLAASGDGAAAGSRMDEKSP